jgi:5-methylcytosine-specific restriction endonuclease McrA
MSTIDISDDFHSLPQVAKALRYPSGANAVGMWLMTLCWLSRGMPKVRTIPSALLRRYNGTDEHVRILLDVGLWVEVGEREYEPARLDHAGRPIWRPTPKPSRPAIPAQVRVAVFARDGRACVECRAGHDLTLDHIFPWSLGGPDTVENLRVLCRPCNSSKGARV